MIRRSFELALIAGMPVFLTGIIQRTRAWWAGRRGQPIFQLAFDLRRLFRKTPVYSRTTTAIFRGAPWVYLATAVACASVAPFDGSTSLVSFPLDFVWMAYLGALGRAAVILAALDTGSSFEGMGAAREALFAALAEPVLFLLLGTFVLASHQTCLTGAVTVHATGLASLLARATGVAALFAFVQVDTGRAPVDDPSTHLELTMIHEVAVLDHSGPDLAAMQLANAIKVAIGVALIASLLNPLAGTGTGVSAATNIAGSIGVAILVGSFESVVARLRLDRVPIYIACALVLGVVALLTSATVSAGHHP